mgnify:CR=1 FL=1
MTDESRAAYLRIAARARDAHVHGYAIFGMGVLSWRTALTFASAPRFKNGVQL